MKKAENAISREEVDRVLKVAAHNFHSKDVYRHARYGYVLACTLCSMYDALDTEVVLAKIDPYDSDGNIPAFLNFITKEE